MRLKAEWIDYFSTPRGWLVCWYYDMEPSKYEPLLGNDGMLRLFLCQGAYKYLLANGGIPGDAEAQAAIRQAKRDCDREAFLAGVAASQQAELDAWAASHPGKTHFRCATRWHNGRKPPTFQEAKTIIRPLVATLPVLSKKNPQAPLCADSWLFTGIFGELDLRMLQNFIADADLDPDYFDALEIIYARLRDSGKDVPPELKEWRLDTLEGRRTRPKGRPGAPSRFGRDLAIWETISVLKRLGMSPTRNDATDKQESACDAVAEITGLDFSTVKKIWVDRRRYGWV